MTGLETPKIVLFGDRSPGVNARRYDMIRDHIRGYSGSLVLEAPHPLLAHRALTEDTSGLVITSLDADYKRRTGLRRQRSHPCAAYPVSDLLGLAASLGKPRLVISPHAPSMALQEMGEYVAIPAYDQDIVDSWLEVQAYDLSSKIEKRANDATAWDLTCILQSSVSCEPLPT